MSKEKLIDAGLGRRMAEPIRPKGLYVTRSAKPPKSVREGSASLALSETPVKEVELPCRFDHPTRIDIWVICSFLKDRST